MPNPNYIKGRKKEYKCIEILKKEGYTYTTRTPGSKGVVDVIGSNRNGFRMIQVKYDSALWSKNRIKSEMKKLSSLELPTGTKVELWIFVRNEGLYKCAETIK